MLRLLGGTPLLPVASSFTVAACAGPTRGTGRLSYQFGAMPAPDLANPAQMATTHVASTLRVTAPGQPAQTYKLAYETFFLTGRSVAKTGGGEIVAGGYFDIKGQPIQDTSGAPKRQFFSDCPDGMSLISLPGAPGSGTKNRLFAVVQFEYTTHNLAGGKMYAQLPSPIAVLTLDQDAATGRLSFVSYHNVDTSRVHGLWITCGASRSPWNTHLSSEEYEPDAAAIGGNKSFAAFSQHLYGDARAANPYHYGHLPEVTVHPDGSGSIQKHYCLGRISHELVQVMPEERTVLMGDDDTNGGSADLAWIRLGHASSAEIKALADTLKAPDIVDVKTQDPGDSSYSAIPLGGKKQWVKFRPGQDKAAAFLETHRYAAVKGGSMGFTKMEGTCVNERDKVAYSAISYVQKAMTDGSGGISIDGPQAGMVYAWKLGGGQSDDSGAPIASAWVPLSGAPLLIGEDLATPDALGNLSHPDKIANPDNLKFSEEMRTLFIGEDSGRHVNNFLWAYQVDSGELARILSTPSGAESTGLHAVDGVNGFHYIMSNFQHAGDWEKPLHDKVKDTLDPIVRAYYNDRYAAAVGYLAIAGLKP